MWKRQGSVKSMACLGKKEQIDVTQVHGLRQEKVAFFIVYQE